MTCDCVIQWSGWLTSIALYPVSKSLPVSAHITYICVSLSWANGMSSAMKSVSNLFLLAPLLSPSLVYNEIIEHYQYIFSLAWVPRSPCHCWNSHWCHFCHAVIVVPPCTATTQGAWEEQAQASVFVSAKLIPLSDTTFLWCMNWVWQGFLKVFFIALFFSLALKSWWPHLKLRFMTVWS